ncbi:MAG TPA: tagaturonate reductase [Hanamia sp.]|nr:tagaturonate reductase [Hanamia sp.]
MNLSRFTLQKISPKTVTIPDENLPDLPEKVLQFGTGILLRGLPDYFIDKANRTGIFNGRIVMVKSTSKGDATAYSKQDGLYTLCERGILGGKKIEKNIIISSVSRVLIARNEWKQVLECAYNKDLKVIISNTSEVGIQLINDDIHQYPPVSFPGKLLAFLYERFIAFKGSKDSGFVIVPTELISENAKKLEAIVLELAHLNSLEPKFIEWIETNNYFCNSLVDRIVPGIPDKKTKNEIEKKLGFRDELLTVSEVYSLWAIEGDKKIKDILSFSKADKGIVIQPDINLHRELKLRILNATHTLSCGIAFHANIDTVQHAMENKISEKFIKNLMRNEIAPAISYKINDDVKEEFILKTLDRFRNPHINHQWKSITLNYTSKMKLRCIPLLIHFYKKNKTIPSLFSLGFAAYLYFMKAVTQNGNQFLGEFEGTPYLIDDEQAEIFFNLWKNDSPDVIVKRTLQNISLWDSDLSLLPGFQKAVLKDLKNIMKDGMMVVLENKVNSGMLK